MISRIAAAASALLVLFSALYVWGIARSRDSDWVVGLVVALPLLAIAAGIGAAAWWTRSPKG